ncbi:MAG: EamA family transporter [Acidobacteriota bacterium]
MTPWSSILWILCSGVIGSVGAAGLKAGAGRLKLNIHALATNWQLIGGVFAYLASSVLFVKGMHQGQLAVLYPIVAVGQVWTLMWSRLLFGEELTRHKLIAVALILTGVSLVGLGSN